MSDINKKTLYWNDPIAPVEYSEDISKEDLENVVGMIISKPRRLGFTDSLRKLQTIEEIESDIWLRDFPQAKRGTNKMKPKNRKKKK